MNQHLSLAPVVTQHAAGSAHTCIPPRTHLLRQRGVRGREGLARSRQRPRARLVVREQVQGVVQGQVQLAHVLRVAACTREARGWWRAVAAREGQIVLLRTRHVPSLCCAPRPARTQPPRVRTCSVRSRSCHAMSLQQYRPPLSPSSTTRHEWPATLLPVHTGAPPARGMRWGDGAGVSNHSTCAGGCCGPGGRWPGGVGGARRGGRLPCLPACLACARAKRARGPCTAHTPPSPTIHTHTHAHAPAPSRPCPARPASAAACAGPAASPRPGPHCRT